MNYVCLYVLGCTKCVQLALHCGHQELYKYIKPVCDSQKQSVRQTNESYLNLSYQINYSA